MLFHQKEEEEKETTLHCLLLPSNSPVIKVSRQYEEGTTPTGGGKKCLGDNVPEQSLKLMPETMECRRNKSDVGGREVPSRYCVSW
jgi:hypothetical protein